ncbi:DUF6415 family natural product biosynthesis protein [Streptomyces chrestomyceticus]|uniref:DUF6415 family natural product biosynthesis protein n=1 Tax=Streptomyces chrestomyceticus TaxID=68185 RepID=UPI00369C33E4
MTYAAIHDPQGLAEAELPLDRETHEQLVRAVLSWTCPAALPPDDYEQVAVVLTGAAHAVATEVRGRTALLPRDDRRLVVTRIVLDEAAGRLAAPGPNTLHGVQHRARLIRALYARLDHLKDALPAASTASAAP